MNKHDYSHLVLKTFALAENYNTSIIELLKPYIGERVLEIGCGIGNITSYLAEHCRLTTTDISTMYLSHIKVDFPELDCKNIDISKPEALELGRSEYSTVVCINVLEHINDDHAALSNIHQLLTSGGKLLLFVPALQQIYGELDKDLMHYRRYNKKNLAATLERIGYRILSAQYMNIVGVLGWYINGKLLKRKKFSVLQPLIFDRCVPLINKIENVLQPLPFGMSLYIIAEKVPPAASHT